MLERIIRLSIRQRYVVLAIALLLAGLGIWAFGRLKIDAVPDITNVQVQINTEAPGFSPLEAEQRVTFPVETAIAGLPGLEYTRSVSRYGLSQVTVVFEDGTYLELLHFTSPPSPDDPNPWAHKHPGWIDFAFLGNDGTPSIAETINRRAEATGSGVRYAGEVRGGREREDGKVLEWLISGPPEGARGTLPFFCGDLTPRDWRVRWS